MPHHDSLPLSGFYPFYIHGIASNVILSTHTLVTSPLPLVSSPNLRAVFAQCPNRPVSLVCITSVSTALCLLVVADLNTTFTMLHGVLKSELGIAASER